LPLRERQAAHLGGPQQNPQLRDFRAVRADFALDLLSVRKVD
jgi:hypothetical protein